MTSRDELDAAAAAAAGVISAEQAAKLYEFLNPGAAAPALSGEEDFRFIRNFHDLFLAIGITLFAVGLAVGVGVIVASNASSAQGGAVATGALCALAAALMWGLGELFARRRRLFLPAIATAIAFTLFAAVAAISLYFGIALGQGLQTESTDVMPPEARAGILLGAAMLVAAPALFYARFRLPFSIGMAGAAAATFVVVCALVFAFEAAPRYLPAIYLGVGAILFVAGVAFDARDPARLSRLSDNGFWLHFAAAPFVLNGAFGLLNQAFVGADAGTVGGSGALLMAVGAEEDGAALMAAVTLGVVAMLGLVSLLINRRVLIVSALITAGVAIGVLLNELGMGAGAMAASTLIVLGAFVLILGAGWRRVRRALLGWVRPGGAWARVFPPEPAAT
jgi:hypothetical protein